MEILNWVLIALSVPLIVAMVLYTVRRARELDRRIDEYHEEQEAAANQPGPINPYEGMAGLYEGIGNREQGIDGTDSRPATRDPRPETRDPADEDKAE
jgi:hypothetical protein